MHPQRRAPPSPLMPLAMVAARGDEANMTYANFHHHNANGHVARHNSSRYRVLTPPCADTKAWLEKENGNA